ncbi:GntR family transcriptional regulator [Alcaligenaceae bacterium SAGV5]|nr:GntR family transcriptional regulator [Alcaligenaceae bacterium SAGV5]
MGSRSRRRICSGSGCRAGSVRGAWRLGEVPDDPSPSPPQAASDRTREASRAAATGREGACRLKQRVFMGVSGWVACCGGWLNGRTGRTVPARVGMRRGWAPATRIVGRPCDGFMAPATSRRPAPPAPAGEWGMMQGASGGRKMAWEGRAEAAPKSVPCLQSPIAGGHALPPRTDHVSHVPRHREIAAVLRMEIRGGTFGVGTRLPTEEELSVRFGASRPTVRTALAALAQEGLIVRRPRTGSTVIATRPLSVLAQQVGSIEELLDYPATTHRRAVASSYIKADHELSSVLRCDADADWFHIGMLRFLGDSTTPLCWSDIYVLPRYAGVQKHPKHEQIPVCVQITEMYDVTIEQADIEIFAGSVPEHLAEPLQAEGGSPALFVIRRYCGADGLPFETTVSVHPESRYRYTFQFRRELKPLARR